MSSIAKRPNGRYRARYRDKTGREHAKHFETEEEAQVWLNEVIDAGLTNESRTTLRTISYGGGVQSTAMCVLATQGKLDEIMGGPIDAALFVNVGDDSEHPATIEYVRNVMMPWAAERGLEVVELHPTRDGKPTTLWQQITYEGSNRDLIPVFGEKGNPLTRACTETFKIRTLRRWQRERGASAKNPVYTALGISTDEIQRAGRGEDAPMERRIYPLLHLGLDRGDCAKVIADAGLPVPPKSSCFFCPYHSEIAWMKLRRETPELFDRAQYLEDLMKERKERQGSLQVWISHKGAMKRTRLSETIAPDEDLEEMLQGRKAKQKMTGDGIGIDGCDSGFCWT